MKRSFIERIFPHSPGSANTLPQYEDDYSVFSSRSAASSPRIILRDSTTASSSPERRRNTSLSPSQYHPKLASSLVRYDDPFLPVERAAKNLEQTFQTLLDAQSEGLSAGGVGIDETDDLSSVGSPTPTPSVATVPTRSGIHPGPKTIPIRQPKVKKITLRGARRGLEKSMLELAALKQQELSLVDQEVVVRDNALKQASDLGNRKQLLEDEIHKIKSEEGHASLRSEVEAVEREIHQLETTLLELKSKHRILVSQLREVESSKDAEMSSYNESLALNENQVKSFLRRPPVPQSLNPGQDPGMYSLKPERRTLQMAQEQWTGEVEILGQRKASVQNEKTALEEGSRLWRDVVQRIREFEKQLRTRTKELASQSQSRSPHRSSMNGHPASGGSLFDPEPSPSPSEAPASMNLILKNLSALITSLEQDLQHAEAKNWNLLICAIGAELVAFEQARDLLQDAAGISSSSTNEVPDDDGINSSHHWQDNSDRLIPTTSNNAPEEEDDPGVDLLSNPILPIERQHQTHEPRSPSSSSNHSLEDTLRAFGNPLADLASASGKGKGKQKALATTKARDDAHLGLASPIKRPLHQTHSRSFSQHQQYRDQSPRQSGDDLGTKERAADPVPSLPVPLASASSSTSNVPSTVGEVVGPNSHDLERTRTAGSEEDDEPGPEFLLSHA